MLVIVNKCGKIALLNQLVYRRHIMYTISLNNEEMFTAPTKRDALLDAKALARDMFITDVISIESGGDKICAFAGSVLY